MRLFLISKTLIRIFIHQVERKQYCGVVCERMHVYVGMCVYAHVYGGPRLTLGVFLSCSLSFILSQDFSLEPRASLTSQVAMEACLFNPRLQAVSSYTCSAFTWVVSSQILVFMLLWQVMSIDQGFVLIEVVLLS